MLRYHRGMFDFSTYEPVAREEVEAALTEAIRSSAGGQMTSGMESFLASVCAKHLSEHLALAGFVVMRHAD